MEVPKLFSEQATDEEKLMNEFLKNEVERQEYMEMRYKIIDEEQFKQDPEEVVIEEKSEDKEELEMKYMEDIFNVEKLKIFEELGLFHINNDTKDNAINNSRGTTSKH